MSTLDEIVGCVENKKDGLGKNIADELVVIFPRKVRNHMIAYKIADMLENCYNLIIKEIQEKEIDGEKMKYILMNGVELVQIYCDKDENTAPRIFYLKTQNEILAESIKRDLNNAYQNLKKEPREFENSNKVERRSK